MSQVEQMDNLRDIDLIDHDLKICIGYSSFVI